MAQSQPEILDLPVLPLRDVVVFPHMVIPLFVGRDKSMRALEKAMEADKRILLVAQKSAETDDPAAGDLYTVGTLAQVLQLLKLPDGTIKVLVEGLSRVTVDKVAEQDGALQGRGTEVEASDAREPRELEAIARSLMSLFEQYVKTNRKLPPELLQTLAGIDEPGRLADTIAAHIGVRLADKQRLLEITEIGDRLELLVGLVDGEIDVQQLEKRIRGRVKSQMEKSQREYYLNEQMKAIQKELGDLDDAPGELEELARKIAEAGMPKPVETKAKAELNKLKQMSPMSAEAAVVRNYLDWLLGVPWKKRTKVRKDLKVAQDTLDADHYGLDKVKERILEYLAVQSRVKQMKGPILCLVGPPGVGKTSLGQSIAKATNRKFVRMSLGGVRDEAEIRGHRRTYVGSMPGRLVQNLNKVGSKNPLFLLDEIDKMSMDFRGDPSSALLEVLDPEQNHTFNDHYLEVDLDLSEVMFVATSNSLNIPGPLLDRMEVIRIPGYTEDEKLNIAMRYLVPKQIKANGLKPEEIEIGSDAIQDVVRYYTRESGVRNLEREVAKICRKVVKEIALAGPQPAAKKAVAKKAKPKALVTVTSKNLDKYLGVRRFDFGRAEEENEIGLVTGLAWTEVGGELLQIESTLVPGKGNLILTGQLGNVMKESASAALSVVRSRAERLGIDVDFLQKQDVHVHVPDGATPKDGPSAGIAMVTSLVSILTKVPIRADVAMTGEITLRGRVSAIGGLKEKLLAALRGGIRTVLIPDENRKDLADIPANVTRDLKIVPVKWIDEVLDLALERPLAPKKAGKEKARKTASRVAVRGKSRTTPGTRVKH
ncbi:MULTISPECIES: endopeptidase La [Xanthomonas]|uniref:Lon protease n=4 Tax=Xanthomonas campestris TaxID=339 RepID=Q8PBY4_XANCP|nr:endopeptidase La [Xanthomonas campestris]AAM40282.1 ATP-dependent serine proteinase La [Xanthomonas campestris pv. campestris str. ATCC 33913]AAY50307.1 ATP-dependent serine proteinase La [Xanthomonas campestris pv. campestris str. 8004]MBD8246310.1 endopeptidase La [Xanthomonas campestris]MBF9173786.1 endopeptidase La [Xanthomonas campestris pv. campestris]MCC5043774.1 endopeptidase La [Xanthomonas campestris]